MNDRLVHFYDAHEKKLCPALTDCRVEYCGDPEQQEYELYLPVDDVSIAGGQRGRGQGPYVLEVVPARRAARGRRCLAAAQL